VDRYGDTCCYPVDRYGDGGQHDGMPSVSPVISMYYLLGIYGINGHEDPWHLQHHYHHDTQHGLYIPSTRASYGKRYSPVP